MLKFRNRNPATRHAQLPAPLAGHGPEGAERATFAAGCFWGVEAAFRKIRGVLQTAVGYTGGRVQPHLPSGLRHRTATPKPSRYGSTPPQVSYTPPPPPPPPSIDAFWRMHNPTTRNRQGWDLGSQYRSAIFVHSADQQVLAISSRDAEQQSLTRPIVTRSPPRQRSTAPRSTTSATSRSGAVPAARSPSVNRTAAKVTKT